MIDGGDIVIKIDIKPLSVNKCFYGARRPTKEYQKYKEDVYNILPYTYKIPEEGSLFVFFRWGLSNKGNDLDNSCKPFLDCLQIKYEFNDNRVYRMLMEKVIVPKGEEFIEFDIKPIDNVNIIVDEVLSA